MSRAGFPARFSTSLFLAALALLLVEGIAVPVIAATPSIESSVTPIQSPVTGTIPNGKTPAGSTVSTASVTVGSFAKQDGTLSKFSRQATGLLPSTIRSAVCSRSSTFSNTVQAQVEVEGMTTTGGISRAGTAGITTDSGSKARGRRTPLSKRITMWTFNCCMAGLSRSISICKWAAVLKRSPSRGAM